MEPKKSFFKRWGEGFKEITPLQQASANVWGSGGAAIGLGMGIVVTAFQGTWWLVVTLTFFTLIQIVTWIGAKQKYVGMKAMEEELKKMEAEQNV